jgi:hypothetical protein
MLSAVEVPVLSEVRVEGSLPARTLGLCSVQAVKKLLLIEEFFYGIMLLVIWGDEKFILSGLC